ncbi:hypothetical protein HK102_001844, partial [Quaeritorhiza haematococci]
MPFAPETILKLIWDTDSRASWDKPLSQTKIIKTLRENITVTHSITHPAAGGLVASRDFIDLNIWKADNPEKSEEPQKIYMAWVGVPDESVSQFQGTLLPMDERTVRGYNQVSERVVEEDGTTATQMTYTVQSEIKGSVPVWVLNRSLGGALETTITAIMNTLKERK